MRRRIYQHSARDCVADVIDPRDTDRTIRVVFDVTSWGMKPDPWNDEPGAPPEVHVRSYLSVGPDLRDLTDEDEAAIEAEILAEHLPEDDGPRFVKLSERRLERDDVWGEP